MTFHQFSTLLAATLVCCAPAHATDFVTTITIAPEHTIGAVSPMIYGQYLEHVQAEEETIYPSLWDDASPFANATGVRTDVTSHVKSLGTPIVRWPGGCFADNYHWEDGIGPQAGRVPKPNHHWGGMESNRFGTDEFLHWCNLTGTQPYINVNLGSGTLEEARRWLEYANGATTTTQGQRRAENGYPQPRGVKYWGIGNETWGEWETGHTDATTYGTSLSLWARALKAQDPTIKVLGVGSEEGNDTAWDLEVLARAGADIDYLTVHMYGLNTIYDGSEYEAVVYTPVYLENRLKRMLEVVDSSPVVQKRTTPLHLSIDEWNIRHFYNAKQNRKSPRTLQDALFTAGFFHAMIRCSPRVSMANHVFLVNGNAALLVNDSDVVWTPMAETFAQYTRWMQGEALQVAMETNATMTPPLPLTAAPGRRPAADYRSPADIPVADAAACLDANGDLVVSVINRSSTAPMTLNFHLPEGYLASETWQLHHENVYASNDFAQPRRVQPVRRAVSAQQSEWKVPSHSITLWKCRKQTP